MRICTAENYTEMSRKAANIISAEIITKPNCVLGLATGSTPIGVYHQLVNWYNKKDLDFSEVRTINLDEYKGLSENDHQSYHNYMHTNLFDKVNIMQENINMPDGLAKNDIEECQRYNKIIENVGGIDLQLLGIGHNGHIGFNEPGQAFEKETHCVQLSASTIYANRRYFENEIDIPKFAYTMGIKTIMQAKKILVVVSGESKAEIVEKAFYGPVTPLVPASILQMHNNVTIVGDKESFSLISELLNRTNLVESIKRMSS